METDMMNGKRVLSVVIPVFNESGNLPELIQRLHDVCQGIPVSTEVILVDDGSKDDSANQIRLAVDRHPELFVGVLLQRNAGQHAAVSAGMHASGGQYVITLDADLQNPPEEIPRVLAKLQEGYDTVGTVRLNRHDSCFRRWASSQVNRMVRLLSGGHAMSDYGCMLRGYSRQVVDAILQCTEHGQFIPMLAMSFSKDSTEIPVSHAERHAGDSKYGLWKLLMLQFDLMTTTTIFPLRLLMFLGAIIAGLGLVFGLMALVMGQNAMYPLFAGAVALTGCQFIGMGLLGEYVGRVFLNTRHRPIFLIREMIRKG